MNRPRCSQCGAFITSDLPGCGRCAFVLKETRTLIAAARAAGFTHSILEGKFATRATEAEALAAYRTQGAAFVALDHPNAAELVTASVVRALDGTCELCGWGGMDLQPGPRGALACEHCIRRYDTVAELVATWLAAGFTHAHRADGTWRVGACDGAPTIPLAGGLAVELIADSWLAFGEDRFREQAAEGDTDEGQAA